VAHLHACRRWPTYMQARRWHSSPRARSPAMARPPRRHVASQQRARARPTAAQLARHGSTPRARPTAIWWPTRALASHGATAYSFGGITPACTRSASGAPLRHVRAAREMRLRLASGCRADAPRGLTVALGTVQPGSCAGSAASLCTYRGKIGARRSVKAGKVMG
jgi:hypothetical protein